MKAILKVFKYSFLVAFICLCIINLTLTFSVYVTKDNYTNIFGYTYFEVLTGSMYDDIKEHDIIIIKLNDNYNVGDIITYKTGDIFVTHRIVELDEDTIITKGDANNVEDDPINRNQVVGKVVKVLKDAGIYIKVLTDKLVIVLLFVMGTIASYIISLVERKEE